MDSKVQEDSSKYIWLIILGERGCVGGSEDFIVFAFFGLLSTWNPA